MPPKVLLAWPGGKTREHEFPRATTVYSPFLGGGSFELHLAHSLGKAVVANDLFCPLVDFWRALKSTRARAAMIAFLHQHHPISRKQYFTWLDLCKQRSLFTKKYGLGSRGAIAYLLIHSSYGSSIRGRWNHSNSRQKPLDMGQWYHDVDGANTLSRISVHCMDWKAFLRTYPMAGRNSASPLYLDPPYMVKRDNLYGFDGELHKGFDHKALRVALGTRAYWMLCYNDCPEIRRLYHGYTIRPVKWAYSIHAVDVGGDTTSREVIILSTGTKLPYNQ
jgi:DNA adenine methylase